MNKIKKMYRDVLLLRLNHKNRKRLKNSNFSIISMNCIGGIISHDLGQRFNSPTVNLWFNASDFLKFCKNLRHYVFECEICEDKQRTNLFKYPVGCLDDITIYFPHNRNFLKAKQKWIERSKRINFDNLFFIMVQRDGCTKKIIEEFDNLNYDNKIIFTTSKYKNYKSAVYLQGMEQSEDSIIDLTKYKGKFTGRRNIDDFDYVSFLNRNM